MINRVSLFAQRRDFYMIIAITIVIAIYSILIEFNNYKNLTRFNSALVTVTVQKHYEKIRYSKKGKKRKVQILKLKSSKGFTFYSSTKTSTRLHVEQTLQLEIWVKRVTFYEYLSGFYAYSKIISKSSKPSYKEKLNTFIASQHEDSKIAQIYQALFSARPLEYDLQKKFSELGISHLIAISGFHLSVLSALLFFLLKYPYKFLQNRYFPYRNYHVDSFFIIATILLAYLLFLGYPPSLLRAFFMLIVGFILYDRGIEVVSMQTLGVSAILLLAFFPRLLFSIGFWLSIAGVFYIFLFLIYFKHLKKIWQFVFIPFWVYLLMLPYSLILFGNFSLYHPLSILWTSLFTLFYPLSIALHIFGIGDLLDSFLNGLLSLHNTATLIKISNYQLLIPIILSILTLLNRYGIYLLLSYSFYIFIYALSS